MPIYEAVVYRRVARLEKALVPVKADSEADARRLVDIAASNPNSLEWNLEYSTTTENPYIDNVEAVADDDDETLIRK